MVAAALASLPVVLVYIYLHKYMVGGLTAGGRFLPSLTTASRPGHHPTGREARHG
jgi:hypothetical protein